MSRRRKSQSQRQRQRQQPRQTQQPSRQFAQQPRPVRNTHADRPSLNVTISLKPDGEIEVDPKYNDAAIEHIDVLYGLANREDFDSAGWSDDRKIAFLIRDVMDGYLAQWEDLGDQENADDGTIPGVPHIKESPVADRFDIAKMGLARSGGQQNE